MTQFAVDSRAGEGVTGDVGAPGARHSECGSHSRDGAEISKFGHGGARENSGGARVGAGRKARPPSVALLAPGAEGPRWYVVELDRGAPPRLMAGETLAEAVERVMRAAGFEGVVPQFLDVEGRLGMAFPGYALVEFDRRGAGWRGIPHLRGVRRIIGADAERPTPIAAVQAAWVLSQFGPAGVQRIAVERVAAVPLAIGVVVRVVGGLGLGWRGVVEASDGRSVWLRVDGRRVRVAQAGVEVVGA